MLAIPCQDAAVADKSNLHNGREVVVGFGIGSRTYTLNCTDNQETNISRSVIATAQGCEECLAGSQTGKPSETRLSLMNGPVNPNAIQRITYSFAGQPIAIQVIGDPTPANNGVFFVLTDTWAAPAWPPTPAATSLVIVCK
jgi:hypothetical protein